MKWTKAERKAHGKKISAMWARKKAAKKNQEEVHEEIKKRTSHKKAAKKEIGGRERLQVKIFFNEDGKMMLDNFQSSDMFLACNSILRDYVSRGIHIYEVRIENV